MSREEKIKYLAYIIEEVEGVKVCIDHLSTYSDEQLEEEVEWYDYLLTK